ncbi:unnamed protein product [Cyprideis torosa]|uniref:Phosphatidylserine synthase n=1 Tax=Cyprideis torosa TaxID=163714 RepID=A0A7R8ZLZ9_9CRUS|nr:unnamed protein product [Cyprideis torosa]CAG0884763.1 unnamed protein product [Cyprideis torosa]
MAEGEEQLVRRESGKVDWKDKTMEWKEKASELVQRTISEAINGDLKSYKTPNGYVTTHDWIGEKEGNRAVLDDGTTTFFWRAHTLTVLFVLICVLLDVAIFEPTREDFDYNTKRGLVAIVAAFVFVGMTITPDGPFKRPHPVVWRLTFNLSVVYELGLIFLIFQTPMDGRKLLRHLDSRLGVPLEEKEYGGNCVIYDESRLDDPFHNVKDKLDLFVPLHFFGWMLKTLVLRDWWLCWVISVMFEVLEYTLEHQLPNFSECWWDHWIMDALVCNGLGIFVGLIILNKFSMHRYCWRGLWKISSYRGKLRRIIAQFGPYSWTDFEWKPTSSLGRWISVLSITLLFLITELNTFYLKFVLWIPADNNLNLIRMFCMLFWGAVGIREIFQYLDDPECDTIGRQCWMLIAIIATEFLVVIKFGKETVTKPIPQHIALLWGLGLVGLIPFPWTGVLCPLISTSVPNRMKDDSKNAALDHLALRGLFLMNEIIRLKCSLEATLSGGHQDMARARYIMGNKAVSSLQIPSAEAEFEALVKVFTKAVPLLPSSLESNELEGKSLPAFCSQFMLSRTAPSMASRKEKKVEEQEEESSQEGLALRPLKKVADKDKSVPELDSSSGPQNPLHWFGVMVPQNLRNAQKNFQSAVELVAEIATAQAELVSIVKAYRGLTLDLADQFQLKCSTSLDTRTLSDTPHPVLDSPSAEQLDPPTEGSISS